MDSTRQQTMGKRRVSVQNLRSYNMGNVIANNKGDTDNKIKYENLLRNLKKVMEKESFYYL
jgi:hypothetical protein